MKTTFRYIGAIILPFLAGWGILLVGKFIVITGKVATNEYSDFPMTPIKAMIILLLFEFFAGYSVVATAYAMAPKFKKLIVGIVSTITITGILSLFRQRYALDCIVGVVGMFAYCGTIYRQHKKRVADKKGKPTSEKPTSYKQPEAYF